MANAPSRAPWWCVAALLGSGSCEEGRLRRFMQKANLLREETKDRSENEVFKGIFEELWRVEE
jgi:hypothetical protein